MERIAAWIGARNQTFGSFFQGHLLPPRTDSRLHIRRNPRFNLLLWSWLVM